MFIKVLISKAVDMSGLVFIKCKQSSIFICTWGVGLKRLESKGNSFLCFPLFLLSGKFALCPTSERTL